MIVIVTVTVILIVIVIVAVLVEGKAEFLYGIVLGPCMSLRTGGF